MPKQWGVWITHDIDHIRVGEHYFRDLFLLRLLGVSTIEVLKGRRSLGSCIKLKWSLLQPDRWNRFDEWIALEKKCRIPSTWFLAVTRGKSLSYTNDEIRPVAKKLKKAGHDLALHGQECEDEEGIRREFGLFKDIVGEKPLGIRMHYLHIKKETFPFLSKLYVYDSSVHGKHLEPPKKTVDMLEIPLHIMDTYLFSPFYSNYTLDEAKGHTEKILAEAKKRGLFVVFDIHPHHLDPTFPRHREYILWLYDRIRKDRTCTRFRIHDGKL